MNSFLPLGTPVLYSHYLRRDTASYPRRQWTPVALPAEMQGFVMGRRTLMNLDVPWEMDTGYVPDLAHAQRFPTYLVAFDLYRNPVRVLPEHLRLVGPQ